MGVRPVCLPIRASMRGNLVAIVKREYEVGVACAGQRSVGP